MRFSFALRRGSTAGSVAFGCRLGPMVERAEAGEVADGVVVTWVDVVDVGCALFAAYAVVGGGAPPFVSFEDDAADGPPVGGEAI